jgi:UDP-N-acetylglucosamine:LPS N-acetylglucosamine transferase
MTEQRKELKICLAASSGGHFSQLLKLSEGWKGYETVCVTTTDVVRDALQNFGRVYVVGECNRNNPWRVFKVWIRCLKVILRERPDVIVSTGAAVGCMTCYLGKLFGARVVWIDSITNVERISLSGRMVRWVADLFLVQWPELARNNANIEYVGAII